MGKKLNSKSKIWVDMVITHEPKTISKILDDLYTLINVYNRTVCKTKGYMTGRFIPTTTELQYYLSKKYESVVLKNPSNPVVALHNNNKVRHYFRKEE